MLSTQRLDRIEVELVEHSSRASRTGIGRYMRELYHSLLPHITVHRTAPIDPPLTRWFSFLHHLPLGVKAHRAGCIVHFTEDLGCSQMLWRPVRPAVATVHDLGMLAWPPETRMHRGLDRLLIRLSYLGLKRMDAIIAVSDHSRQMVIQKLGIPAERVFAVHSGHDRRAFKRVSGAREQLAAKFGLPNASDQKYLLYVGSEFPRKNLAALLSALSALPPNVRLLKVGDSGGKRFRRRTEQLTRRLGLEERVFFFERVPETDLPLFYSAADVYICASYLEGFGHPVLEAMACGTPVVCSDCAALPEVAGDAALLVPPGSAAAIGEAVLSILRDRALAGRLATAGRRRAARFTWERTAEGVISVYRQVLEANVSCL